MLNPWIANEIVDYGGGHYRYGVTGTHRESGQSFSWSVPSLDGFDTAGARRLTIAQWRRRQALASFVVARRTMRARMGAYNRTQSHWVRACYLKAFLLIRKRDWDRAMVAVSDLDRAL